MAVKRLSDKEIQEKLDQALSGKKTLTNSDSDKNVARYSALYDALREPPQFEPSPGFTQAVMNRVAIEAEAGKRFRFWQILFAALMILGGLSVTVWSISLVPLTGPQINMEQATGFLIALQEFMNDLHLDFGLLATALTVLLFLGILDSVLSGRFRFTASLR